MLSDHPFAASLGVVFQLAVDAIDCDGAAIAVVDDGRPTTATRGHARIGRVDALQYQIDEGPCVTCLLSGTEQGIDSTPDDQCWPHFSHYAFQQGVLSCLTVTLSVNRAEMRAALNLYSRSAGAFGTSQRRAAVRFVRRPPTRSRTHGSTPGGGRRLRASTDGWVAQTMWSNRPPAS